MAWIAEEEDRDGACATAIDRGSNKAVGLGGIDRLFYCAWKIFGVKRRQRPRVKHASATVHALKHSLIYKSFIGSGFTGGFVC